MDSSSLSHDYRFSAAKILNSYQTAKHFIEFMIIIFSIIMFSIIAFMIYGIRRGTKKAHLGHSGLKDYIR
jgi:hypothetical protein